MQKVSDTVSTFKTEPANLSFRRSPSIKVTRVRHDDSTSNLVRHVKNCDGSALVGAGSLKEFAHGSSYTPHQFRMKLALWVARRHRPFAIVEDAELVDIFKDLNNKVEVPSRSTVSRDVKEIFDMSRKRVAAMLKVRTLLHLSLQRAIASCTLRPIQENSTFALMDGHRRMLSPLSDSPYTGSARVKSNQPSLILSSTFSLFYLSCTFAYATDM
jgi:hypothetical protein